MNRIKQRLIYLFFCMAALFISAACSSDNDSGGDPYPDDRFDRALHYKYPNATRVEWREVSTYRVATCYVNGYQKEAWFDVATNWAMTVTEINNKELPNAVEKAVAAGEFSSWRIGEVDLLEFSGRERVYVLKAGSGATDLNLYYSSLGDLLKITDSTEDYRPDMDLS